MPGEGEQVRQLAHRGEVHAAGQLHGHVSSEPAQVQLEPGHTLADAGTTGKVGPDLDKAIAKDPPADIRKNIVNPNADVYPGYPKGVMPQDYGKTLSPAELSALVNYLDKVTSK